VLHIDLEKVTTFPLPQGVEVPVLNLTGNVLRFLMEDESVLVIPTGISEPITAERVVAVNSEGLPLMADHLLPVYSMVTAPWREFYSREVRQDLENFLNQSRGFYVMMLEDVASAHPIRQFSHVVVPVFHCVDIEGNIIYKGDDFRSFYSSGRQVLLSELKKS
jgi:hypothetical protein